MIAFGLASSWLREGGNIVFAPLQFPNSSFTSENLKKLYGTDIQKYSNSFVHIEFDQSIDSLELIDQNHIKANLVKPAIWDMVIKESQKRFEESKLGTLLFSTALNLPLFSRTYGEKLMEKFQQMLVDENSLSYLFCISISMLKEKAELIGEKSDNLIETEISNDPKRLNFEIIRAKNTECYSETLEAPFSQDTLEKAEERARKYRVAPVESIKKI